MIYFSIMGEKAQNSNGSISYRVMCKDLATKKLFTCRSAVPVAGHMGGGFCNEIKPAGSKITIGAEEITLVRDTGIDATFSCKATIDNANAFELAVA